LTRVGTAIDEKSSYRRTLSFDLLGGGLSVHGKAVPNQILWHAASLVRDWEAEGQLTPEAKAEPITIKKA